MKDSRQTLPCPRCAQGCILEASIVGPGTPIWVCEECEATWFSSSDVSDFNFVDLGTYLESIGKKPLWSELHVK